MKQAIKKAYLQGSTPINKKLLATLKECIKKETFPLLSDFTALFGQPHVKVCLLVFFPNIQIVTNILIFVYRLIVTIIQLNVISLNQSMAKCHPSNPSSIRIQVQVEVKVQIRWIMWFR